MVLYLRIVCILLYILGHVALASLIHYILLARLLTEFLEVALELVTPEYFGEQ